MSNVLQDAIAKLLSAWGAFDAALKSEFAGGGAVTPPLPPIAAPEWPRVIQAGGMNIMAYAPISPAWKSENMMTMILGGAFGMGSSVGVSVVADPSNGMQAKPTMPVRSPRGFPLSYALDRDGKVIGSASVSYGEHSFNNDDEVLDYIKRVEDPARFEVASTWSDVTGRIAAQGPVALPPTPAPPAPLPPAEGSPVEIG